MKLIKTAIIGFGKSAEIFHAPFIVKNPGFRLISVLERNSERSRVKYPFVKLIRNLDEFLQDPDTDLVVITTPNITHYEYTKQSLLHNKHVIIEKPFTITTSEADELIKIAKEKYLTLAVYHNRRWDGDFMTVRELIRSGKLGEITEFESHFDRYRPELKPNSWKEEPLPGSGIVYDLGSHLIDQCLQLFGSPETINSVIEKQRINSRIDDYFKITLHYKNLICILTAGMMVKEPKLRFRVEGTKASFIKNELDPQENDLMQGKDPLNSEWGRESEVNYGKLIFEKSEELVPTIPGRYQNFYNNVYNVIVNKEKLLVKPQQAREVISIIERCYK